MESTRHQPTVERLYSLSKEASPGALAQEAERAATSESASQLERCVAVVLWAYGLLRQDSHKHRDVAAHLTTGAKTMLEGERINDPFIVDWAMLTAATCWQLLGVHDNAAALLDKILASPDVDIAHRIKGAFSRAFSLYSLGRHQEALATYLDLAAELDRLPDVQQTLGTRRDRQRLRLNTADHYLNAGDVNAAAEALAGLEEEYMTPLMSAARLAAQARVAMMRDQWVEAEQTANRANDAALEVNYIPLRLDALGVLVACAARKNSRDEQHRLVTEMATLLQAK